MTDTGSDPAKAGQNKKIGLIFLLVAIAAAVGITRCQRDLRPPPGWIDNDLDEAMRQARANNANVVVLFVAKPPTATCRELRDTTLSREANNEALREGNFVAVMVRVPWNRRDEIAEQYEVTGYPTTMILSPEGEVLRRMEGFIGETDFRYEFLVLDGPAGP